MNWKTIKKKQSWSDLRYYPGGPEASKNYNDHFGD
jgi:hypothetical protein